MANTYTQIYLQFVFAVARRECLIPPEHKAELHRYIGGLVKARGLKPLAIHCPQDHAHIFVGYEPVKSIPDFVKEIKVESNQFINQKRWTPFRFGWQDGYGAFSYSRSQISRVINYIDNQEKHHATKKFSTEYKALLKAFEIPFDERYLFRFFD